MVGHAGMLAMVLPSPMCIFRCRDSTATGTPTLMEAGDHLQSCD